MQGCDMNHIRISPIPSPYLTLAGLWWEIRYLGLPVRAAPATVSPPMLSLER